jgi:hypothetical protein
VHGDTYRVRGDSPRMHGVSSHLPGHSLRVHGDSPRVHGDSPGRIVSRAGGERVDEQMGGRVGRDRTLRAHSFRICLSWGVASVFLQNGLPQFERHSSEAKFTRHINARYSSSA